MTTTDPPPSYEARPNKYIHLANLILILRDIKMDDDAAAEAFRSFCLDLERLQGMIEVGEDRVVDEAQAQIMVQLIRSQWPSMPKKKCGLKLGQKLQTAYSFAQKELLDAFPHKSSIRRMVNFVQENPKTALAGAALFLLVQRSLRPRL